MVTFRTRQGGELRGSLLHLTPHSATVEVYSPDSVVKNSEVLEDFRVLAGDRLMYSGRAVIQELVNAGTVLVCSVMLDDSGFITDLLASLDEPGQVAQQFDGFVREWQDICRVTPEFKVAVADIQGFLIDFRRWLEHVELGLRSSPTLDYRQRERKVVDEISQRAVPMIDTLFEKFEVLTRALDPAGRPAHRAYIQRHLHPIVLCAPFAYRCYAKPLGYAGDYEMVSMMARDPREGGSLFAKVFNVWLLHQGSAAAHRNRIQLLSERLIEETATAVRAGRKARVLSVGCGPALEVQKFLAASALSNQCEFTLLDFDDEALQHAGQAIRDRMREHGRESSFTFVKRSVQQLLKDAGRPGGLAKGNRFDFVYCAGLFDYLPDRICRKLLTVLYESLAPDGLVLATNVAPFTPNRGSLELILDWHLIYRDAGKVAALRPEGLPLDSMRVHSDQTGVNVFLEARATNGH